MSKTFLDDKKGSFGIMLALLAVPSIVGIGMALDTARAIKHHSNIQAALDASLIGAISSDGTFDATLAEDIFLSNIQSDDTTSVTLNSSGIANVPTYTEVSADNWIAHYDEKMPLTFPNIFQGDYWDISVETGAQLTQGTSSAVNMGCIYTLSDGSQSLLQNSGATITAPGCTINVGTVLQQNNGKTGFNNGINFDIVKVCVAGKLNYDNRSDKSSPVVETSCATPGDFLKPVAVDMMTSTDFTQVKNGSCINNNWISYDQNNIPVWTGTNEINQDPGYKYAEPGDRVLVLSPGKYCGGVNFNSGSYKIFMKPGLYYVQNDWNINGNDIIGDNVSVFFDTNGKWQPNSNTGIKMSAPTSGVFKGFAFWENPNASSYKDWTINSTKSYSYMDGITYLPNRRVTFNSGANSKYNTTFMVKELTVNGNTKMTFDALNPDHIPTNGNFSPPMTGTNVASSNKVRLTQ